jgi:hypothetical protein
MGTWTAFYVEGGAESEVVAHCLDWLELRRGIWARLTGRRPQARSTQVPDDFWSWGSFRLRGGPDRLAVFPHSRKWTTVLYNGFFDPNTLAAAVSAGGKCRVVDTQGQTTSDAYLLGVYDSGKSIRTLEFAVDVGWVRNLGPALPNEPDPLESPLEDEPEEKGWFDADAVERYLARVFDIAWWKLPPSGTQVTVIE